MSYENGKSYKTFDIDYVENPKAEYIQFKKGYEELHPSIYIPSTMHSYSLAIQYMRDWFLNQFDKDYWKTVYVNGSHILNDYKRYSIIQSTYREKPAVAITPNIDFDYDREMLDKYMGGRNFIMAKYNHRQGFFKDYENNIFLGMNVREQKVQFNFKCRVETRAQQLDLYRTIELAFRIGFTQKEYIACDFHIPMEIMLNIANHAGFEIEKDAKGNESIKDIVAFTTYLNKHSNFPMMYKLRQVSGKNEFFMRVNNVYCNIDTRENLNYDDGEREGHLENNFHVEMNAVLTMWVPAFYVFKTHKALYKYVKTADSSSIGLWTTEVVDVPEVNDRGWQLLMHTEYELDKEEIEAGEFDIDISSLFINNDIYSVFRLDLKMGISPARFFDIQFIKLENADQVKISMDWKNMIIHVKNCTQNKLLLAFYIDKGYYNTQLITLKDMNTTRIDK